MASCQKLIKWLDARSLESGLMPEAREWLDARSLESGLVSLESGLIPGAREWL